MRKLKNYEDFKREELNEEINRKKLAGLGLAGLLATGVGIAGHKTYKQYNYDEVPVTPGQTVNLELPNHFTIEEYVMSIGNDYIVKVGDSKYGTIDEKVISIAKQYTLNDNAGNQIARARQKIISWGAEIDVFDENDAKIGSVEEKVFESLLGFYTSYEVKDAAGKVIATSEKLEAGVTNFTVKDKNGKVICTMRRPLFNVFSDTWEVEFQDGTADKRLFIFIPCYKTAADNAAESESDDD